MSSTFLNQLMRAVAETARIPVIVTLFFFLAFSLFSIGTIASEAWTERCHIEYRLSRLMEKFQNDPVRLLPELIKDSGLLRRHRDILLEIASHPSFDRELLESLADNLLEKEQSHYDAILSATSIVSRLAPMAGLLGTLIPLGPGIIALSAGDTHTLSQSLLTAFDTTIIGFIASAICLVIGAIRQHWYSRYMSDLQTLADCVVDCCCKPTSDIR